MRLRGLPGKCFERLRCDTRPDPIKRALSPERGAGIFLPTDRLLLKIDRGSIPVLERDADLSDHEVASALHPVRPFLADPNHGVEVFWLLCSVLEPHEVAWRVLARGR